MNKPVNNSKVKELSEDDYRALTQDLVREINRLRKDPRSYVEILEKDRELFKEDILYRLDQAPLKTKEGPAAHDEAIEFLNRQEPVEELELDERLTNAARDHVVDIGPNGLTTHEGSNKESISDRIEKYAEWDFFLCQNIDFGASNVQEILISFLTSDGDPTRSHRDNLFKRESRFFGAFSGSHRDYAHCTVVIYAGNVRDLNSTPPEVKDWLEIHKRRQEELKNQPKKKKTKYQITDPNAPDNAVSYTTFKKMKLVNGKAKNVTQRIYTLDDGTQHIVEEYEDLKKVEFPKN